MWIGKIGFMIWTKDTRHAGTDNLVTMDILRDGTKLWGGRLDFPAEDDLEPGAQRFYGYDVPGLHLDETPALPPGIGRIPAPYPGHGMEFSHGLRGHLRCRLLIHGADMWTKDRIDIWVKEIRQLATSFDTLEWIEDTNWARLGSWTQDVNMSLDIFEGTPAWTLVV